MSAAGERERLTQIGDAIRALMADHDVWPNLPDALRDGFTDAITALDGLLSRVTELEEALRGYHELAPALADCANDCGAAVLYSTLHRANQAADAVLAAKSEKDEWACCGGPHIVQDVRHYEERGWGHAAFCPSRAGVPATDTPRVTHGRHCHCSACAQEDWTNPNLAPCGMHGPDCPNEYAPTAWGQPYADAMAASSPVPATDTEGV